MGSPLSAWRADGVNLNLVRAHIIRRKQQIEEECPLFAGMGICTREVPPVVPADKPDSTTTAVTTTRKETIVYEPVVDDTPNEVAPAVTTSAVTTTTQKPSDTTPPAEQKPADNGFPSNPSSGGEYVDDKGQTWIYNGIARRWIEGGSINVETAPDFTPSGNVILS